LDLAISLHPKTSLRAHRVEAALVQGDQQAVIGKVINTLSAPRGTRSGSAC
jgi:hypothetical protein